MKTITLIPVLFLALSINTTAQIRTKNPPRHPELAAGPKPIDYVPRNAPQNDQGPVAQNNNQQNSNHWGNGWNHGHNNGYVSFNYGYNSGYNNNYNNYYGNGYGMKKQTRYSIQAAGQIINQAVAFDSWNDTYSPMLAKAIRHYEYARQLYWYGDYQSALNHAERAHYLAWYSLQYFQNGCNGNYGGNYQPDPYSDPYNPYYKTNQTGNVNADQGNRTKEISQNENMDGKLPKSEVNDKELLKTFDRSELKDE